MADGQQVGTAAADDQSKTEAEIIELSISELQRTLDWIDTAYQRVKAKTTLFLGAGLALLTFLYADSDTFIPCETAGRIFYFCGLALVIGSLVLLFISLWPRTWDFSIVCADIKKISKKPTETFLRSRKSYLAYMLKQYISCYESNLKTYESNHRILNYAFYPLVIGAIILIVFKIFGT